MTILDIGWRKIPISLIEPDAAYAAPKAPLFHGLFRVHELLAQLVKAGPFKRQVKAVCSQPVEIWYPREYPQRVYYFRRRFPRSFGAVLDLELRNGYDSSRGKRTPLHG